MARTNKKGGNTAGLRGWSAFTDAEKNLDNTSKSDGRANSSTFQKSEGSPQKIVPAVLGVLGAADLAYQGYKYYKGRKKKKAAEEEARKAELKKRVANMTPEQKAKLREKFPFGKKKGGAKGSSAASAVAKGAANIAKTTKKAMPKADSAPKPKSSKKLTWAEAKKNDPNLSKYVAERKKHQKGSPEYKAVQAKINAAYRA
jgi:hypothetical protein